MEETVHYDVPKSIEGYYQETGRAGRDGINSHCLMLYSYTDIIKLEKFQRSKGVNENENAFFLLEEIAAYAESGVCRRKQLLHYFGENYEVDNCEQCDNCIHPRNSYEGAEAVEIVLDAVKNTEGRFDMSYLVDVILGKRTRSIRSYGHDKLDVFGKGNELVLHEMPWKSIIRQAFLLKLLDKNKNNPYIYTISKKGEEFLKAPPYSFTLTKEHDYETDYREAEEIDRASVDPEETFDKVLFGMLKQLQKNVARRENIPPYVIFSDPSLREMSTLYPTKMDDIKQIIGVGEGKAKKFAEPFLQIIKEYVEENDIITASDVIVKTPAKKSRNKIFIIQQVDQKIDFEEIAEERSISYEELIHEIENICYSGTKLNIDYYVNHLLDNESQEDIYNYFIEAESDDILQAIEELGEHYSEDEIRLMRVKFMSEYAH